MNYYYNKLANFNSFVTKGVLHLGKILPIQAHSAESVHLLSS